MEQINLIELGKMLSNGFNNAELSTLVFEIDATYSTDLQGEVSHLPKSEKVSEIIRFSNRIGALTQVVKFAEDNNEFQFNRFKDVLYQEVSLAEGNLVATTQSPVSNEASSDIRYVVAEMTGLMREMINESTGKTVNIHAEKVNYAEGGSVTDNSKNYSIGDVGDNVTLAQGAGAQATSDRSVSVGGKNTGNIITGDENTVTDKSKKQDIKIEGSTISGSNIGIMADEIKNSFNTVAQSEASSEVKTALKAMLDAVAKLDEVIEESKDLKIIKKMSTNIVQEVDDEILDEEQANTYIERLKKAAHNIGDIAKPVIDTAVAVAVALKATGVF